MIKDMVSAGVILGACIFFYALTFQINVVAGFEEMAPSLWPRFNLIGMAVMACLILGRAVWTKIRTKATDAAAKASFPLVPVAGSIGILFGFIFLTPYLGFLFTALLATAAGMRLLSEKNKMVMIVLPLVLVALIYVVFGRVMGVPMPRGVGIFQDISYFLY